MTVSEAIVVVRNNCGNGLNAGPGEEKSRKARTNRGQGSTKLSAQQLTYQSEARRSQR